MNLRYGTVTKRPYNLVADSDSFLRSVQRVECAAFVVECLCNQLSDDGRIDLTEPSSDLVAYVRNLFMLAQLMIYAALDEQGCSNPF